MSEHHLEAEQSLLRRVVVGRRTRGVERAAFAMLGLILVLGAFGNDWGAFYPDNKPEIYLAPASTIERSLQTWQTSPKQAGFASFDTGVAPLAAVSWVLRSSGLEPWLAVRVWRAALLVIAAFGVVRLLDHLDRDRPHAAARLGAAAVYTCNPYLVLQGTTTAVLLPYALLPWFLVWLDRSLDEPRRWRSPAATVLVLAAMSGINAGVIPMLLVGLCVPALVAHRRLEDQIPWRDVGDALVRCGALGLAVSLYWLVPAVLAAATGAAVAGATEPTDAIGQATSFMESLRLTGMWTLYGRTGSRLFTPSYAVFVTSAAVVLATAALPVAAAVGALLSRARSRSLAALLLALGLPVMVGVFPTSDRAPLGTAMRWGFDNVPGMIGFRTTNKAAPVVALALALLIAEGAGAIAARSAGRPVALRAAVASLAALVVATASFPTWSGNLYRQTFEVPEYWEAVGDDLDAGDAATRVLIVPGGSGANYRWGMRSPDEVFSSVTDREVVARSTVAPPDSPAANLLAHLDTALGDQTLPPGALSTVARYLGAGEVVARSDYRWEEVRAARPAAVMGALRGDDGLDDAVLYGPAGRYTARVLEPDETPSPLDLSERRLEAVARFPVLDPLPMVRTASVGEALVVVGDNGALGELARLGMLEGTPPVLLAGALDPGDARAALEQGAGVVLTDTNRRRSGGINRVRGAWSETLTAAEPTDAGEGPSPTLWPDDPTQQTTTRLVGASSVESSVPVFGASASGKPELAFDGDLGTGWITGRLGTGVGQWIEITFDEPIELSTFDLVPIGDDGMRIAAVRATADHATAEFAVSADRRQRATLQAGATQRLRIEITAIEGTATTGVGFHEIAIPGIEVHEIAVLPTDLDRFAADPATAELLARAPMDVVLQRQRQQPFERSDDEERRLDRDVSLPVDRAFTVTATLAGTAQLPPEVFLEVVGGFTDGAPLDDDRCYAIATIDGTPLEARLDGDFWSLVRGQSIDLTPCDPAPIALAAGRHEIRATPGWELDTIHLRSPGSATSTASAPPIVAVHDSSPTSLSVDVSVAEAPYLLTTGRAWDPRWEATMDGEPLGEPLVVDGYAAGWRIDDLGPHRIEVRYGPQSWLAPAIGVSILALLVCIALVLRGRRTL